MSGIAVIFNRDGAPVSEAALCSMTSAMSYRGPDGINQAIRGSIGFGQCHMRTTPESFFETLPLSNESGDLMLVLAGRADNNAALRSELTGKGAVLRNCSDAELFLRAYEVWGTSCVQHIDGDFAFAIWDARKGQLFCGRDRIGYKPLFYFSNERTFIAASDIRAVVEALDFMPSANMGVLADYLRMEFITPSETLWTGVQRLVPAHTLQANVERVSIERYWTPDTRAIVKGSEREIIDQYMAVLRESIARSSRASSRIACEVSGGLDSSAVFAMAHRLEEQGELRAPGFFGLTLDFDYETEANELEFVDAVANYLGRPVQRIAPSRFPLSWHESQARQHLDFPSYPNGVMAVGVREAARHAGSRVLLVGVGGDEWLGGTRYAYAETLGAGQIGELWRLMKEDASSKGWLAALRYLLQFGFYPYAPEKFRHVVRTLFRAYQQPAFDWAHWLSTPMKQSVEARSKPVSRVRNRYYGRIGHRQQFVSLESVFSILAREREERLAALSGLELRWPLASASMVSFAFALPERYRYLGGVNKILHRKAMKGILPELVRTRGTKADFMESFRWYMDDIVSWMGDAKHLAALVDPSAARQLAASVGRDDLGGNPEWLLWTLFGVQSVLELSRRSSTKSL